MLLETYACAQRHLGRDPGDSLCSHTCCLHHIQLQYPHIPSQLLSQPGPLSITMGGCVSLPAFHGVRPPRLATELAGALILMEACICDLCIPPSVGGGVLVEMLIMVERSYTSSSRHKASAHTQVTPGSLWPGVLALDFTTPTASSHLSDCSQGWPPS